MSQFIPQITVKHSVCLEGIGVHSGQKIQLTLHPAEPNTGIVFRRVDLTPIVEIPATTAFVRDTQLNTSISRDGATVATIEHIMSAFAGLKIDNAYVDVDAAEMPIMDGSAKPFVSLIHQAQIEPQNAARKFIRIREKIRVDNGDQWVSLEPFEGCKFSLSIAFDHPVISNSEQTVAFDFSQHDYAAEIAMARTFGFLSEYEYLRKNHLAQGASLENTVVVGDNAVMNPEGLRHPGEFVRHKLLDAIGDLYMLGHPLMGSFQGYKSGHHLNHQLRQALLAQPEAWEITAF